jgi:hypothetical protein
VIGNGAVGGGGGGASAGCRDVGGGPRAAALAARPDAPAAHGTMAMTRPPAARSASRPPS